MILRAFLLSIFLFGCASQKPPEVSVVDFADGEGKEAITITEKANSDYGPSPETRSDSDEEKKPEPKIIALDLFPALYDSLGYLSTFKQLEESKIHVNIVSSSGFTSVIAALYAKYEVSNMVEWKTFELYQILGKEKPFSDEWNESLRDFLDREFGGKKLSQLKKLLVIPLIKNGRVLFDTGRKVTDAVMDSLNLSGEASFLAVGKFGYLNGLKRYGADHVWRISFLPAKISLKYPDGYVFGIYSRLAGKASSIKQTKNTFIYDEALEGDIDSFKNLSDALYQTRDENKAFSEIVLQVLERDQ